MRHFKGKIGNAHARCHVTGWEFQPKSLFVKQRFRLKLSPKARVRFVSVTNRSDQRLCLYLNLDLTRFYYREDCRTDSGQTLQDRRKPGFAWLCKISRQSVQRAGNAAPIISKISTFR